MIEIIKNKNGRILYEEGVSDGIRYLIITDFISEYYGSCRITRYIDGRFYNHGKYSKDIIKTYEDLTTTKL